MMTLRTRWAARLAALTLVAAPLVAPSVQAADSSVLETAPVSDVKIANGVLTGTLRDGSGAPVDGALVVIGQRGVEIARTTTDREGRYQITNLQAGQYVVVSGNVGRVVRLWETATAPPAAAPEALLDEAAGATRGQIAGASLLSISTTTVAVGGAIAGIAIGAEAQDDADEAKQENARIQQEFDEFRMKAENSLANP